ncbi:MAG: HAD family hydrolase [Chitinispirillales bacterium]|jgi:D-glycero-D-manno-heptose 1,7-bisphosphate phosphatase|nr:HAD family hydrolase [Chitinispirillales bacterium]
MNCAEKKALFLDRDGIINEDCRYPHKPEQIVFKEGIFELCRYAAAKGYIIVVVTNQAGVAKGYFTEDDVKTLHIWMSERFKENGVEITAFYYCPFHPKGVIESYRFDSDCRKPEPGMLLRASIDHGIDIGRSLMVGDKESDRIALSELKSIVLKSDYVKSGYDIESLKDVYEYLS